jgi:hypothetical protein
MDVVYDDRLEVTDEGYVDSFVVERGGCCP